MAEHTKLPATLILAEDNQDAGCLDQADLESTKFDTVWDLNVTGVRYANVAAGEERALARSPR